MDYDSANVVVTYPQRFELRDRRADLDFLVRAKEVTERIGSPTLRREIDRQLARGGVIHEQRKISFNFSLPCECGIMPKVPYLIPKYKTITQS